jgi:hypothetical protein
MNYNNSPSTMYALSVREVETKQRMLYRLVEDAIRKKVVKTGWTG